MNATNKSFLGTGWAFPISVNSAGEIATVSLEEDIRQSVRIILGTAPGERVMRPDFGAGLGKLVFEPINNTTISLAQHYVEQALVTWEPRIDTVTVAVTPDTPNGRLTIDIRYRVRTTNTFYNLVYPFYLTEGDNS
ncbi:MAG TPA: GPW/gp25 family protein [Verrucomicrobiae bacterium]|nr:GPW/gp25 family protein [Verrucomicrobiae bacterium]